MRAVAARAQPVLLRIHNNSRQAGLQQVAIYWGSLPAGTTVLVALSNGSGGGAVAHDVLPVGVVSAKSEARRFPAEIDAGSDTRVTIGKADIFKIHAPSGGRAMLPEILVHNGKPGWIAILADLPRQYTRPAQFDIVQFEGSRVAGGFTIKFAASSRTPPTRLREKSHA